MPFPFRASPASSCLRRPSLLAALCAFGLLTGAAQAESPLVLHGKVVAAPSVFKVTLVQESTASAYLSRRSVTSSAVPIASRP